jgi:hypothetical protein
VVHRHLAGAVPVLLLAVITFPLWLAMLDSETLLGVLGFVATCAGMLVVIALGVPIYVCDRERRTARIFYDVDDPALLERLAMCNAATEWLAHASRLWHIYYSAPTNDWKTNAGASTLIQRTPTRVAPNALPGVELNIGVYSVPFGPQHPLFLPDRLIVREGARLAGVPYDQLRVAAQATRFIEDAAPPPDTQVVDWTWQFVNKSGGPDRRFANNRQLPVCRYGEIELATAAGLRVVLQTSNADAAIRAGEILSELRTLALGQPEQLPVQPMPVAPVPPPSQDRRAWIGPSRRCFVSSPWPTARSTKRRQPRP